MNSEFAQDVSENACGAIVRNPGILIADDMAWILNLLKFEMESRGFNVWLAVDGDDAIDLYSRHQDKVDVVLLDVQMPGLDGPQTLEALQRLNPAVVACFMSGNLEAYTEEDLLDRGAKLIFSKPFRAAEVADFLQRVLNSGSPLIVHPANRSAASGKAIPAALTSFRTKRREAPSPPRHPENDPGSDTGSLPSYPRDSAPLASI
jgi:CheY-like chemotaxis protein